MSRTSRLAAVTLFTAVTGLAPHAGAAPAATNGGPPAAPGVAVPTPTPETLYVQMKPCRIADTTKTNPLKVNKTRVLQVSGTTGFEAQGGKAGGCGIPAAASSVTLLVTTTRSANTGQLKVWSAGDNAPLSSSVTYGKGGPLAETVDSDLSGNGQLAIQAKTAATDAIVDVTGYFVPQIAARISNTGTIFSATRRIVSSNRIATGFYEVITDRDITYCSILVTITGGAYYASAYPDGNRAVVQTWALSGGGAVVNNDLYFNILVSC